MMTLIYSAAGGVLSWCMLCLLRKPLTREQIWLASPVAAIFHNLDPSPSPSRTPGLRSKNLYS